MSTNGLVWAVNHSAWCKNAGEFAVLVAIANHVGKDLKGCRANQSTLGNLARCNKRTAGTHVRALADRKLILPGDLELVKHIRQDLRPDVWDLNAALPDQPGNAAASRFCLPRQAKSARPDKQDSPDRQANSDATTGKDQHSDAQDLPTEPGSEPGHEPGNEPGQSSAEPPTAQMIVSEWLDRCPERPPSRVIGHLSKEIKTLLDDGIDPDNIRRGIARWMQKGLHPSTLPSVVNEVMNAIASPQTTGSKPRRERIPDSAYHDEGQRF